MRKCVQLSSKSRKNNRSLHFTAKTGMSAKSLRTTSSRTKLVSNLLRRLRAPQRTHGQMTDWSPYAYRLVSMDWFVSKSRLFEQLIPLHFRIWFHFFRIQKVAIYWSINMGFSQAFRHLKPMFSSIDKI